MMVLGSLRKPQRRWKCATLNTRVSVSDRQERIVGWNQAALAKSRGLQVGGGGIGGAIGQGLVKKGVGRLDICDHDSVAPENLNRQLFGREDLYKNKAERLCRRLSKEGFLGTELRAYPCAFQALDLDSLTPDFVVCGVDNQLPDTRLAVCRWCFTRGIPAVFVAVTRNADAGYVLVQKPQEACWECVQKSAMAVPAATHDGNGEGEGSESDQAVRCPGTPASIDILLLVAGYALYALDSLVMARPRSWNYLYLSLSRPEMNRSAMAVRRTDCAVCGSADGKSE